MSDCRAEAVAYCNFEPLFFWDIVHLGCEKEKNHVEQYNI